MTAPRPALGSERRITISLEERRRPAYHEAGRAILGMLAPARDAVCTVSSVPRARVRENLRPGLL
jgi:cell division protease FtsH